MSLDLSIPLRYNRDDVMEITVITNRSLITLRNNFQFVTTLQIEMIYSISTDTFIKN